MNIIFMLFLPFVMIFQSILFVFGYNCKWAEQFIFKAKKRFFINDISIIGYSVFPIIILVIVYEGLRKIGMYFPLFPDFGRAIVYPFIFTFLGFGVSLMLALRLITKQIETGEEFLMHLIEHISSFEKKQENNVINIITPNINIGTGVSTKKWKKEKKGKEEKTLPLIEIIKNNTHITFNFICMSIDKNYIEEYATIQDANKISFFENGESRKSPMLKYLFDRYYNKDIETLDKIVSELSTIIKCANVKIISCKKDFNKYPVVGYISNKECIIGMSSDIESKKGNVRIKGERVSSKEFIDVVEQHLLTEFIDHTACN